MTVIGFPNPVNEKAARVVAGFVLILSTLTLILSLAADDRWTWIVAGLAIGFYLRVLSGPKLSPIGRLSAFVIAPHLGEPVLVAGPPKRFAQAMGATITTAATILLVVGLPGGAQVLLVLMIGAAALESIAAFCVGCTVFAGLMKLGWIPEETCVACANIWTQPQP